MMSKIYGTCQFCDEKQFCSNVISQQRHLYRNFVLEHRQTSGLKPLKSYKSDRWSSSHWQKNYSKFWNAFCQKLQYLLLFWNSSYWIWLASPKSIRSGSHRARDPAQHGRFHRRFSSLGPKCIKPYNSISISESKCLVQNASFPLSLNPSVVVV